MRPHPPPKPENGNDKRLWKFPHNMSANKLYYRPRRTRKRFLYLRSCNGFILVRLSKAGYRFRVNAEDGYRGSAVSCSVFLTTQMGRYGLQANHVSFKNRKNSKKWPIRRRHFFGRLKNEIVVRTFLRRGMSSSASDQSF